MINHRSSKLSWYLSIVMLLIGLLILMFNAFQFADRWLSDNQLSAYASTLTPNPNIVVLDIDDESIEKMLHFTDAGSWPWPRSVHAEVVEALASVNPRAIVFDIFFSEPDIHRPDSDDYFNEVIAALNFVYVGILHLTSSQFNTGELLSAMPNSLGLVKTPNAVKDARAHLLLPYAIDEQSWRTGSVNFSQDSDGIGRRYDLFRPMQGWHLPSLPAKVALDLGASIPDQQSIILRWKGVTPSAIPTYSYADVYQAITENNTNVLAQFTDKVIVIGSTASGLHDIRATPISKQHPAVYIVATTIDNLLQQRFITTANPFYLWLLSGIAMGCASLLFWSKLSFRRQLIVSALITAMFSTVLVLASYFLLHSDTRLAVATPILLGLLTYLVFSLSHGLREHMERKQAVTLFGRFVDPKVVDSLIKSGELDIENTSQEATLTVLFSDIRGFTSLSEQRSASQIVTLLNAYFGRQVNIIFKHKGTLDKFIGDCIMAFWGAPTENTNQAIDAVKAALEMADELVEFRKTLATESTDLQDFDVGIGIHTGPAVVGMIGANERVDYTAIGDTVNLASRIEGLTKGKARILVSEDTKKACTDSSGDSPFEFLYCGEFSVKGREEKVLLYQPTRIIQ